MWSLTRDQVGSAKYNSGLRYREGLSQPSCLMIGCDQHCSDLATWWLHKTLVKQKA